MGQTSSLPNRRHEVVLQGTEGPGALQSSHHYNMGAEVSTSGENSNHRERSDGEGTGTSVSRVGRFRRHLTAFSRLSGLSPNRHHTTSVSRVPYSMGTRRRSMFGTSVLRRNTVFELPQTHFSVSPNQLTTTEHLDLHALNRNGYTFSVRDFPLIDVPGGENFIPERPIMDLPANTERPLFRGIIRRSQRNNTLSRNTRRALEISGRIRTNNDAIIQHSFNGGGLNAISLRPGEDQAAMLSRLLSVAAAATAASLVGNNEQAIAEAHDIALSQNPTDDRDSHIVDGSFESFLRALQNGRLAAALRNGGSENGGGIPNEENASVQPLNFFRMFRFGNSQGNTQQGEDDLQNPRLVPIIIVGIRSVPPRDIADPNTQHTSPFFDTLANLSVNMPLNYETSYHRNNESREQSDQSFFPPGPSTHSIPVSERLGYSSANFMNENIPGSEVPSGHLNIMRPLSVPSVSSVPVSASQNSRSTAQTTQQFNINTQTPSHPRTPNVQRRSPSYLENLFTQRSQSANEHVPENRNSVDNNVSDLNNNATGRTTNHNADRTSNSGSSRTGSSDANISGNNNTDNRHNSTRSWIIYVLGGSYPEDHPILTTPSLFTDSPTYEDMLLLSSLIGPAKSPVATKDEIESAGGLHVLSVNSSAADIYLDERCVICLNNYQIGEECRELNKCKHFFHKACIDEWLMTGRNTCPTCRAEGVNSRKNESSTSNISTEGTNTNISMTDI
ncbi:unnamed protein product [Pneumocystis jirovecii]|uniref:RING-type domain-containing protein n=2 Tax=Pneumocystis jirovecii TaxID=42068 RepID=L0PHS7_PNEJI|nr:uncharacterized protein T551_01952 [Pneumocystis jirovecii RU7]KTW30008.1 hypothetical protein T551_01952 [Pneumocystis jirovecii RU7]CCJ31220.1 unnamed protein product [Pneumocystis jirovecii]